MYDLELACFIHKAVALLLSTCIIYKLFCGRINAWSGLMSTMPLALCSYVQWNVSLNVNTLYHADFAWVLATHGSMDLAWAIIQEWASSIHIMSCMYAPEHLPVGVGTCPGQYSVSILLHSEILRVAFVGVSSWLKYTVKFWRQWDLKCSKIHVWYGMFRRCQQWAYNIYINSVLIYSKIREWWLQRSAWKHFNNEPIFVYVCILYNARALT
jgi:hypothetical protein